ncbi:concanavalin A-like lectin/glucanase domain-containing protein [Neurospora hispaniola]|uniref:Crh-like protein n=1 Tax=Neurospora hispaniola TaxID=588809 RepID=A0AAJ0MV61_9PEZI|nr:concanavalin A-like lectin/glucanase domain-containing protein [Neurospora hispaniola]
MGNDTLSLLLLRLFLVLSALVALAAAQSGTDCNPIKTSGCPQDIGLTNNPYSIDFTKGTMDQASWTSVGAGSVIYTSQGAVLALSKKGDAPTISTNWYIFFGRVEVLMRAAPGTGIVSSVVLGSDDGDEIDWELIGGNNDEVQTNYFGKGNVTLYNRGGNSAVHDVQGTRHNYTIDWQIGQLTWYVDGKAVRTLKEEDAVGGLNYPQTPMKLRIGSWAGGDPDNAPGTIAWAGGVTDYTKGPFTMYVERVSVTNQYPAASYSYGDMSGNWDSIVLKKDGAADGNQSKEDIVKEDGSTGVASATNSSLSSSSPSSSQSSPTLYYLSFPLAKALDLHFHPRRPPSFPPPLTSTHPPSSSQATTSARATSEGHLSITSSPVQGASRDVTR